MISMESSRKYINRIKEHSFDSNINDTKGSFSFAKYILILIIVNILIIVFLGKYENEESGIRADFISNYSIKEKQTEIPYLNLHAKSAILMDKNTQRVLYEKNANEVLPMASTTKIMTCILALELCDENEEVIVSSYASKQPAVKAGIIEGEIYRLGDLLELMMLESYNDVAVAIAEHIGGSIEGFGNIMNNKAKELGMKDSFFVTPNGLDAEMNGKNHSTTAYDMGVLTSYALENYRFREIIETKEVEVQDKEKKHTIMGNNKDAFLNMMDCAIGVKTGFTNKAGYCFVGAINDGEKELVAVILASGWPPHKNWKWQDTIKIMEFGIECYEYHDNNFCTPDMLCEIIENNRSYYSKARNRTIKDSSYNNQILYSDFDQVKELYFYPRIISGVTNLEKNVVGEHIICVNDTIVKKDKLYIDFEKPEYDNWIQILFKGLM